jgi:ribulose-bisphosphate carboxylase large chain
MLQYDPDAREDALRAIVSEHLSCGPAPQIADSVVATYFFIARTQTLDHLAKEISYHATSGIKHPPEGSLLQQCTATLVGVDAFDDSGRVGIVHVAFPLKMLQQPDGHVTSTDLLHTVAAAAMFDMYEVQDARLITLEIPEPVLRAFPGPAYGPDGLRKMTEFPSDQPAFGTILKPTAGLVPGDVEEIVAEASLCPLFLLIKEDEDLYPNLDYCPIGERTRRAVAAVARARHARDGRGVIFAPHITGAPHEIVETVKVVVEAGAEGVMFSETFAGGTVRMVREATKDLERPPAIYGHNAGIGTRTRAIWREVIDLLARLDGIDFRQTAPVTSGSPLLRPYGAELLASEAALTRPAGNAKSTMIVRAGGLDQGNIILNLQDAEQRDISTQVLFLAGSAINSVVGTDGRPDPRLGAMAMQEALVVHQSGEMRDVPSHIHLSELVSIASRRRLSALREALRQRYPSGAA